MSLKKWKKLILPKTLTCEKLQPVISTASSLILFLNIHSVSRGAISMIDMALVAWGPWVCSTVEYWSRGYRKESSSAIFHSHKLCWLYAVFVRIFSENFLHFPFFFQSNQVVLLCRRNWYFSVMKKFKDSKQKAFWKSLRLLYFLKISPCAFYGLD